MNVVIVKGNLGRDPEMVQAGENQKCTFSLAIKQAKKDEPLWLDVAVWGRQAETCNGNLRKGSEVVVEGRLCIDKWVDKEGGRRQKAYVTARVVEFCGPRSMSNGGSPQSPHSSADDIPF